MSEMKWECWESKLLGKIRNIKNVIWLRKFLRKRADKKWAKLTANGKWYFEGGE